MTILDALAKAGVSFVALKENIRVEGKRDIQTKVMTTLFALFAEVERDLISERTREGLGKSIVELSSTTITIAAGETVADAVGAAGLPRTPRGGTPRRSAPMRRSTSRRRRCSRSSAMTA